MTIAGPLRRLLSTVMVRPSADRDRVSVLTLVVPAIDPGLVQVPYWRPDGPGLADAGKVWILGGVGRKPGPPSAEGM